MTIKFDANKLFHLEDTQARRLSKLRGLGDEMSSLASAANEFWDRAVGDTPAFNVPYEQRTFDVKDPEQILAFLNANRIASAERKFQADVEHRINAAQRYKFYHRQLQDIRAAWQAEREEYLTQGAVLLNCQQYAGVAR